MDNRALRRGNASLSLVHAAQAMVILALSTDFSLPVTGAFMEGQPGSGPPTQDLLFDLRIGPLVGAFLMLAALDHALVALPPLRARYERCLAAGSECWEGRCGPAAASARTRPRGGDSSRAGRGRDRCARERG